MRVLASVLVMTGCATGGDLENEQPIARDSAVADSVTRDTALLDTFAPDTFDPDTFAPDTFTPDTFTPDTFTPDTSVADTAMPPADAPCGPTAVTGAGTCAAGMPVSLDLTCAQTFNGDTCSGATVSNSCGAGQAQIFPLSISSGARLYAIKVSGGFSLASIPGPPICGGAGTCAGSGMSTGIGAGSKQWWTVTKTGGGCGAYTLTITPS
jgi:hypothetical protein